MTWRFNDDMICRDDLPRDVFLLLHDLAYDREGRDRQYYRTGAQIILMTRSGASQCDVMAPFREVPKTKKQAARQRGEEPRK